MSNSLWILVGGAALVILGAILTRSRRHDRDHVPMGYVSDQWVAQHRSGQPHE